MAKFYRPTPERAPRTHNFRTLLVFILLFTTVDFATTVLLTIPCLRNLYARQNNVDYVLYLRETEMTALQQQNVALEKELRLLKQDVVILESILHSGEYVPAKE